MFLQILFKSVDIYLFCHQTRKVAVFFLDTLYFKFTVSEFCPPDIVRLLHFMLVPKSSNLCNYINRLNVYLPCVGSSDRSVICNDVLDNILSWMSRYQGCECVIAGDFNVNLDGNDALTLRINSLMNDCSLARCDDIVPSQKLNTYVNHSLKQESCIETRKLY